MKPRLFIGSSIEAVKIAYAVQQNLRDEAEVTVWDQGVFKLSAFALESLLGILDTSDFGLFIFSPDDVLTIREDEIASVRDNVVFELGLFFGRLGKGRCFILTPDDALDLRIPADLLGILPGTYEANRSDNNLNAATAPASQKIQEQIQELGIPAQLPSVPAEVFTWAKDAFVAASEEVFEAGFDSNFSLTLDALVRTHGKVAIEVLDQAIRNERNFEVKAEATQQIGSIEDARTHNRRLALLLHHLKSEDARIRDAASIGLADMDDPSAIPAVGEALRRETSASLRRNLELVLGQLEETVAAPVEG